MSRSESAQTLVWKLTELSRHGDRAGSLKARLSLSNGPSHATQSFVQFQVSIECYIYTLFIRVKYY